MCNAGRDKEKEHEYLRMLQANQVDGIIAGAHNLGIEEYKQLGLPIVSFDRKLSDNVPIVSCDNFVAFFENSSSMFCTSSAKNGLIIPGKINPTRFILLP